MTILGVAAGGEEPWPNSLFSVPKSFIYGRSMSTPLHVRPVQWESQSGQLTGIYPREMDVPTRGPERLSVKQCISVDLIRWKKLVQ